MPKRSREENDRLRHLLANLEHLSPQEQEELRELHRMDDEPQQEETHVNPSVDRGTNDAPTLAANTAFNLLNLMADENRGENMEDRVDSEDGTVTHQLGAVRALTPDPAVAALQAQIEEQRRFMEEQRQTILGMQNTINTLARAQTPNPPQPPTSAQPTQGALQLSTTGGSLFTQFVPQPTAGTVFVSNDYHQAVESLRAEISQLLNHQGDTISLSPTFFSRFNVVRMQSDGLDSRSMTDLAFAAVANTLLNRGSLDRTNHNISAAVETIIFYILAEGARGPDARPQTAERTIAYAAELRDAVLGIRSTQLRRNIAVITNQRLGQSQQPNNTNQAPGTILRCQFCGRSGHTALRCNSFPGLGRGGMQGRGGGRGGGFLGGRGSGQGASNQQNHSANSSNNSNGTQAAPTKPG